MYSKVHCYLWFVKIHASLLIYNPNQLLFYTWREKQAQVHCKFRVQSILEYKVHIWAHQASTYHC